MSERLHVACTRAAAAEVGARVERFNRRQALLAAAAAALAAGCRDNGSGAVSSVPIAPPGPGRTEQEVSLAAARGALARGSVATFVRRSAVRASAHVFASERALVQALHRHGDAYDVVVLRQDLLTLAADEGLLYELDHDLLPHLRLIDAPFADPSFDRGNRFSVAKHYGVTGFGYRRDRLRERPRSWADFYRLLPRYAGRGTSWVDGADENVACALAALGEDANTDDDSSLAAARRLLLRARPHVDLVSSTLYVERFVHGTLVLAMGWNGDFARIMRHRRRRDDTVFVFPEGRSDYWVESWAVSAATPHPFAAHAWIDFAISPPGAIRDWDRGRWSVPERSVLPHVRRAVRDDPTLVVDPDVLSRYDVVLPTPAGVQRRAEIWEAALAT